MRVLVGGYLSDDGLSDFGIRSLGARSLTVEEQEKAAAAQMAAMDATQAQMISAGDFSFAKSDLGPSAPLEPRLSVAKNMAQLPTSEFPLTVAAAQAFIKKAEAEIAARPAAIAAKTAEDAAKAAADRLAAEQALKQTEAAKITMQAKIDEVMKALSLTVAQSAAPDPIKADLQNLALIKQENLKNQLLAASSTDAMNRVLDEAKSGATRFQMMAQDIEQGKIDSAAALVNREIAHVEGLSTVTIVALSVAGTALLGLGLALIL